MPATKRPCPRPAGDEEAGHQHTPLGRLQQGIAPVEGAAHRGDDLEVVLQRRGRRHEHVEPAAARRRGHEVGLHVHHPAHPRGLRRRHARYRLERLGAAGADEAGRAALRQSVALGFTPASAATDPAVDPRTQILQSLFLERKFPELIQSAQELVTAANGAAVPELWLTYGLQGAIETQNAEAAATFSVPLVQQPSPRNVRNAVRVALSQAGVRNGPIMADAMRLLYEANAMTAESDVAAYVGSLDARLMANEVLRVLEAMAAE